MTEEIICPICGLERVPSDKEKCPQCDADLTCFKVLNYLPDSLISEKKGSGKMVIMLSSITVVVVLTITMTLFHFYRFRHLESLLTDQRNFIIDSLSDMAAKCEQSLQNRSEHMKAGYVDKEGVDNRKVSAVESTGTKDDREEDAGKGDFLVYHAKEDDTLWDISEQYYGSGYLYPVLLENNPNLGIYMIGEGVTVKVLKNRGSAEGLYNKITVKEGGNIYWYYTVKEGETFRSIAEKFYKSGAMARQLSDLNLDNRIQPGERIRILLK